MHVWDEFELVLPLSGLTVRGLRNRVAGDPIICLHGWLDNCHSFLRLTDQLPDQPFFLVDMPGHGQSSHLPRGQAYHFLDSIAWIEELRLTLEIERVSFLCHSLGACFALYYAGVFPNLVKDVVNIDSLGPFSGMVEKTTEYLQKHIRSRLSKNHPSGTPSIYPSFERMVEARAKAGQFDTSVAELLVKRNTIRVPGGYRWTTDKSLITPSIIYQTEEQVKQVLENVTSPVLLIWDQDSEVFPSKYLKIRGPYISHMDITELRGGHHLHLTNAPEVAEAIAKFWQTAVPNQTHVS